MVYDQVLNCNSLRKNEVRILIVPDAARVP